MVPGKSQEANLPVATRDVDERQDDLVWKVIDVNAERTNALAFATQMDLVENDGVDKIHDDSGSE